MKSFCKALTVAVTRRGKYRTSTRLLRFGKHKLWFTYSRNKLLIQNSGFEVLRIEPVASNSFILHIEKKITPKHGNHAKQFKDSSELLESNEEWPGQKQDEYLEGIMKK